MLIIIRSPEWKFISEDQRKDMGLVFDNDGEFWLVNMNIILNLDTQF